MNEGQTFSDIRSAARFVLERIASMPREHAAVVALYGDLGAGKTTFAQTAAEMLGIQERVISPTFILERAYALPEQALPFTHFIHIDAYRLAGADDLKQIGWDELIAHSENIVFVEWADKVEGALPADAIRIRFTFTGETTRTITIQERKAAHE